MQESALRDHGAVSQEVVEQMAIGVKRKLNTDYGLATSGIAGPTGGTTEKPVGTIWIALATKDGVISKLNLGYSRDRIYTLPHYLCLTCLDWYVEKLEFRFMYFFNGFFSISPGNKLHLINAFIITKPYFQDFFY